MIGAEVFHRDWSAKPLWWEDAPPQPAATQSPERCDVVIIGAGYCGLSAARVLAQAGKKVVVLDSGKPGWGAATRNHGMVAGGLRIPVDIDARVGPERGEAMRRGAKQSFIDFKARIEKESLPVDFAHGGRFTGAHTPAAFERQRRRGIYLRETFGYETRLLPREQQRSEIGSDFYYGALLVEESGGLHPAKLYREYRRLAEEAGAAIIGETEARGIEGRRGAFRVITAAGAIAAADVFLATNAYTGVINGALSPFIARRLVPVTAYMIATEEMPADLAREILPTNRMCGDTKRSLFAFRLSPDRKRMVFAGRAKFRDIPEREATPILHGFMCKVFPQLKDVKITHSWKGLVCFTFDDLPHMGIVDGVHYAAGCQGNGVVMMSYLGEQSAQKMLTNAAAQCGFDTDCFPARPLYYGEPWFLPAVGAYYKIRDAIERYAAARTAPSASARS